MVAGPLPLSKRKEGHWSEATREYSSNGLSDQPRRLMRKGCGAPCRKGAGDGRAVVMNSKVRPVSVAPYYTVALPGETEPLTA